MNNLYEHAQEELTPSIDEEEFQECEQFNTDKDLEPPTDDILEFITSQGHSDVSSFAYLSSIPTITI